MPLTGGDVLPAGAVLLVGGVTAATVFVHGALVL